MSNTATSTKATTTKTFGVSQAICQKFPTEKDITLTKALNDCLISFKSFESKEESKKRVEVLKSLNVLVNNWVRNITETRLPNGSEVNAKAKLMTFGSYRLNVHSAGGDIDTVVCTPRHVTRSDFFSSLKSMLISDSKVKNLNAVEKAFVPLMTFEYDGVDIDLLFARLNMPTIPDNLDLTNDDLLMNLEPECVRSLNGVRVAEQLLSLVPNQETFGIALRTIKIWAKNHGIYSNSMGFFGGITWAILVARTCQLYLNSAPSKLVHRVFLFFSSWDWKSPIILNFLSQERIEMGNLNSLVWGRNYADKFHLMPILTPAFPEQNSTHNVSKSTMEVIQRELKEALRTCEDINNGKAEWKDLLEKMNFFSLYKNFLAVKLDTSKDIGSEGFMESRIRQLVNTLERNYAVKIAHVHPKMYKSAGNESTWFIGLDFHQNIKNLDLTSDIEFFKKGLISQANKSKISGVCNMDIIFTKRAQLIKILPAAELKKGKFYGAELKSTEAKENVKNGKKRQLGGDSKDSGAPLAKRAVLGKVN